MGHKLRKSDTEDLDTSAGIGLTKEQIQELGELIDVRQDTIDEDPESASGLVEQVHYGLKALKDKLEGDFVQPPMNAEKEWLKAELESQLMHIENNIASDGIKHHRKHKQWLLDIAKKLNIKLA